jgi:phosphopantetheinyl transferase
LPLFILKNNNNESYISKFNCSMALVSYFCTMPLIHFQQINSATKIGVWHITEGENFFLEKVNVQREITHHHKRLQHLAGRYLLQELFPHFPTALIEIAETRKPFLADEAFHFSISHCGDYAAAIVSTANRVGVDIEIPHPKVERIQHKFITEAEQEILKEINYAGKLTMVWGIKEAMFKWYGVGEVDFKKNMKIESIEKKRNGYKANCLFSKEIPIILHVQNINLEGNNLAWVVT